MSVPFVIWSNLILILSGGALIFHSAKYRNIENKNMKANVYLGLGLVPLCLGGINLLLEIL